MTLKKIVSEIPTEISTCKDITGDLKDIEEWAKVFTDKTKLIARVTRNMALHHKAISNDIKSLKADFSNENYFKAGEDAADLLAHALGTVTAESTMDFVHESADCSADD
jgi:hypothetical protein